MNQNARIVTPYGACSAYLSVPDSGSGPGILVCHAWWGLNKTFQAICDRLAQEGFVSLAPDLFHGGIAETIEQATTLRNTVDRKKAKVEVRSALDFLAEHDAVRSTHLGALGFSYGCGYALEAARLRPQLVRAVTLFYGSGGGNFNKTEAQFQGHFAAHDEWGAHEKKVQSLKDRIERAGREATFYTYPDTQHWFFEPDRAEFSPEAAQQAWQRTMTFLKTHLLS